MSAYQLELGQRLRQLRTGLGLSLDAVERKSAGRWKACSIGTYERGDRALSAERLVGLADWYGADPGWLLTGETGTADGRETLREEIGRDLERIVAKLRGAS